MKVFLDANVIVSVLNKEYPLFTLSSRILSESGKTRFELYTSTLALAICFYFSSKKNGQQIAKRKIGLLNQNLQLTSIDSSTAERALSNPAIHDFEDGLQYYASIDAKCGCIITENLSDYYYSDIEVLNCEQFFRKYMVKP